MAASRVEKMAHARAACSAAALVLSWAVSMGAYLVASLAVRRENAMVDM